jgi:hypothetical protein
VYLVLKRFKFFESAIDNISAATNPDIDLVDLIKTNVDKPRVKEDEGLTSSTV